MATTPPPLPVKSRKTGSTPVIVSGHQKASNCSIESTGNVVKIHLNVKPASRTAPTFQHAVRINICPEDMILKQEYFNYNYVGPSGQSSPSETPDSGTCSDVDGSTPPPLPKKKSPREPHPSDDEISCDSLNSSELEAESSRPLQVQERTYEERGPGPQREHLHPDSFYNFHLNENCFDDESKGQVTEDDTFAGRKCVDGDASVKTIRSAKGTIRGVKNRVRAGIATFLQMNAATKSWQEREAGKVVVYTTTMGIVRETAQRCLKVRHILRTHLVKYVEKDVFMSREIQAEIKLRMGSEYVLLPQVFVEGQYIGDADTIEKLNESGELRRILKPYKSREACTTCEVCGGYRLLPCGVCNGSKKSVHRNHFTTELVALKCMNCDEVGLVKCYNC